MSGSTARSDLVGANVALDTAGDAGWAPPRPGFVGRLVLGYGTGIVDPLPVSFVVDGAAAAPRVLAHRWDPDFTETVYALTDALRLTERKGVRGDVLCADWRFEGSGRVDVRAPAPASLLARGVEIPLRIEQKPYRLRCALGGGPAIGDLHERPFADWLARHAPRLHCASPELAELYAYRWFVVYRSLRRPWGERDARFFEAAEPTGRALPLQLREARWMRSPVGVQASLDAWSAGGLRAHAADPLTPAIEFGEHHRLDFAALRDAALNYVLARGGFDGFPAATGSLGTGCDYAPDFAAEVDWDRARGEQVRLRRVDTDVWHWGLVRALGGPDLRDAFARIHLHGGYFRSVGALPIRTVLGWEAALPFLFADFGARERTALARAIDAWSGPHGLYSTAPSCPAFDADEAGSWSGAGWHAGTSWVLHALGAVAARTREAPLVERFAREWKTWTAAQRPLVHEGVHPDSGRPYRLRPEHFRSAWLDTFLRHVLIDGLVDVGPIRVEGLPWKEEEISLERDGPGGPARVSGSRRSSPPR